MAEFTQAELREMQSFGLTPYSTRSQAMMLFGSNEFGARYQYVIDGRYTWLNKLFDDKGTGYTPSPEQKDRFEARMKANIDQIKNKRYANFWEDVDLYLDSLDFYPAMMEYVLGKGYPDNLTAALTQQQQADAKAAIPAATKKKSWFGKILSAVGNTIVDVAKLGVQGIMMPVSALNGGKTVLGDEWNPTTGVGKALDSVIDKLDEFGHKVGQIYVNVQTGGIVDLSKGGIFQKDGLTKTINIEAAAKKGAETAMNSETGQNLINSSGLNNYNFQDELKSFTDAIKTSGITESLNNLNTNSNTMGLLDSLKDQLPTVTQIKDSLTGNGNTGVAGYLPNPAPTQIQNLTATTTDNTSTTKASVATTDNTNWFKKQWDKLMAWKKENPTMFWVYVIGGPILLAVLIWLLIKYVFKKGKSKRF